LPDLSYFTPRMRYLSVQSADLPSRRGWLPRGPDRAGGALWVLWAEERVGAIDALACAPGSASAAGVGLGMEAPAIGSLLDRFRKTGGGKVSPKLALQLIRLPGD
jgi:hypothetical protein